MITVLSEIFPVFAIITFGYIAGHFKLLPQESGKILCKLLMDFCYPASFFVSILQSEFGEIFNPRFALCFMVSETIMITFFTLLFAKGFGIKGKNLVMRVFGSFYGNLAYVGTPVFLRLFGTVGPIPLGILIHSVIPLPITLFLLDLNDHPGQKFSLRKCSEVVIRNPIIIASFLAAVLLGMNISLPSVLMETLNEFGKPATAIALFALGFTCTGGNGETFSRSAILKASVVSFLKLIVCPFIAWLTTRWIPMEASLTRFLILICMLPCAMNTFVFSQQYNAEPESGRACVLISTFFYVITVTVFLAFL